MVTIRAVRHTRARNVFSGVREPSPRYRELMTTILVDVDRAAGNVLAVVSEFLGGGNRAVLTDACKLVDTP